MGRNLFVLLFLGVLALSSPCLAGRRVNDLERLVAKEQLSELHWFYNGNMDAAAALRSKWPATPAGTAQAIADPEFAARVANIRDVFCPDPIFKGWTATGGANGGVQMATRYRDILDTQAFPAAGGPQSVVSIYRDVLPIIFGNSSQHFVGMPIVTVYYDGNVLRAEFNATLRQVVNIFQAPPAMVTDIMGHYNNKFVYLDPPGQGRTDAYWCMEQFNAFNSFSFSQFASTYYLAEQNANDAQLSVSRKPDVRG
jgi:hypothetical protein